VLITDQSIQQQTQFEVYGNCMRNAAITLAKLLTGASSGLLPTAVMTRNQMIQGQEPTLLRLRTL
jgi:hypothetical protein